MNRITYEQRKNVYAAALRTYGVNIQAVVAIEELSELQKEICKALRGECNTDNLAEEIADATIMLEQLRDIFDINDAVCEKMDEKVERLQRRIERNKNKAKGLKTIGEHIKQNRIGAGLTRQCLAAVSGLGYNRIGNYERDQRTPDCLALIDLADALGISVDRLIGHEVVQK